MCASPLAWLISSCVDSNVAFQLVIIPIAPVHVGDLDSIDTKLPETAEVSLGYLAQCVLSLAVVSIVFPWFCLPMVPIMGLFIYVARYFRKCARELKRLEGTHELTLLFTC